MRNKLLRVPAIRQTVFSTYWRERKFMRNSLALLLSCLTLSAAHAAEDAYPSKSIRIIITVAPGGGSDITARTVAQKLTESWKQQVIVDNRPGGNGIIGMEIGARANADGYTLILGTIGLLAGNVQMILATVSTAITYVKAGRIRAIAVTSAKRVEQFSDLPTIAEAGVPGFAVDNWYGFFAPRGTRKPVITKLHAEINRILLVPDEKDRLAALGIFPFLMPTPDAFGDYIKDEIKKYSKVVRDSGSRID